MRKKKVLICGATGFIGRNIAEAFMEREDFEVYGTYLKSEPLNMHGINMIQADLTDRVDVNRVTQGVDIIIQAAATTSGANEIVNKPFYHVTDNAVMNSLIFRAAHEHNVSHVIFFSCTVMYKSSNNPVKETDFDANGDIYPKYFGTAWTKLYIEKMCEFYSGIGPTKYTAIRHSNIYGPHDKFDLERSHVFGATMTKVMTSESGAITVWGSGEEERDLLYVSDLVDFVELSIDKQKANYELLNAGSGEAISVNNLVKKIIACSGNDIRIEYDISKPTINTSLCLDSSKSLDLLGWKPQVSLDEGIRITMEWYKENVIKMDGVACDC